MEVSFDGKNLETGAPPLAKLGVSGGEKKGFFGDFWGAFFPGKNDLFDLKGEYPLPSGNWISDQAPAMMFSSVLMNVVGWVVNLATETETRIINLDDKKDSEEGEPLLELLGTTGDPSLFVNLSALSFLLFGNAFWLIKRNRYGLARELGFVMPWDIHANDQSFMGRNRLHRETVARYWKIGDTRVPVSDIIHVRNGIDLTETRLGYPTPKQILSEIVMDAKAAGYAQDVLRNFGIAGNLISPDVDIQPEDARKAAEDFDKKFGPGFRGGTFVSTQPVKHTIMKADIFQGVDLRTLRAICEERTSSAYRIQPSVVGFGSEEQVKMGTMMSVAIQSSWRAGVVPVLSAIKRQVKRRLFPEMGLDPKKLDMEFESSAIAALQESPMERARRLSLALGRNPWMTTNEARRWESLDPRPEAEYDKIPELSTPTQGSPEGGAPSGKAPAS